VLSAIGPPVDAPIARMAGGRRTRGVIGKSEDMTLELTTIGVGQRSIDTCYNVAEGGSL
jgi:hypothetical protein